MASLKLEGVSKTYLSGALALHNVNLQLDDHEFIAVVGAEKSGKSTLLRVIAGLEEVSSGKITVGGKDVTEQDVKDRDVAVVFRNDGLSPNATVYDNLAYGLQLRKAPQALIDGRVNAVANILGLTDVLGRKVKQISSLQRQKTALGRAVVREPALYLFDDPVAGLDGELKEQVRNIIVNLQARLQGTFVYATKNVGEALTMASRIVVLRDGLVQQIDTPANLYDYPANAYVAFLIGSPTINLFEGVTLESGDEGVAAVFGGNRLILPETIVARLTDKEEYVGTGKKVILGIRPEDLSAQGGGLLQATVTDVEEMGGKTYAQADAGEKWSITLPAEGVKKGDVLGVSADLTHATIFDATTRLTLLKRDAGYVDTGFADASYQPLPFGEQESIVKKHAAKPPKKK